MPLSSCSACRRHVRSTERACPFCGATALVDLPRRRKAHVGRAAMAASVTVALACGARTDMGEVIFVGDASTGTDASSHDASAVDTGQDTGFVVLYGPAPQDGGVRDAAMTETGPVPVYGAPPPPPEAGSD